MFNKSGDLDFKKGWKTTEFWVAFIPVVMIVLSALGVDVTSADVSNWIYAAGAVVSASYVLGRSILKAFRVKAVAQITTANTYANAVPAQVTGFEANPETNA